MLHCNDGRSWNHFDEHVSEFAMDLLDEPRWALSECLLVLKFLPAEADVAFIDLQQHLVTAQLNAKVVYEACSLMHQGPELDEPWGSGPSRPMAVVARHNAAVRGGSPRVRPLPTISDGFERHVWQPPGLDRSQDFSGARPQCSALVRDTGKPCSGVAIYLGAGTFAAHCPEDSEPGLRREPRSGGHHRASRCLSI